MNPCKRPFLTVIITLCFSSTLLAQEYKAELRGQMLPARIKHITGAEADVLMKYQTFQYFKFPQHKFRISETKSEADAYDLTGGILAFAIDGLIWAQRPVPGSYEVQFVIMRRQGAIETYSYVKYGAVEDKETQQYVVIGSQTENVTHKVGTREVVEGNGTEEQIRKWIADIPEAVEDLKKAEAAAAASKAKQDSIAATGGAKPKETKYKGLLGAIEKGNNMNEEVKDKASTMVDWGRIINNYNALYEERNRGKITYEFVSAPTWIPLPKKQKTPEDANAERKAKLEKLYANRPSTASAEIASVKDNVPVKKETFAGKMRRIKGDGNKIGVLLNLQPVHIPKPSSTANISFSQELTIEDEYMDESLRAAGAELVQELNQALGTTDIELIDINKIPYRNVKVMGMQTKLDDWWATKYKVVFVNTVDPQIRATHESMDGKQKFQASLNLISSLLITEYIGAPDSDKRDNLAQVLNFGSFVSPAFAQEEDMTDMKAIYDRTLEKLKTPILEKMKTEREENIKKLVEKKLN